MRPFIMFIPLLFILPSCKTNVRPIAMEFRVADRDQSAGLERMVLSGWGRTDTFYVQGTVELTQAEVISAEVIMIDDHPAIALEFSDRGAAIMSRVTGENVERHVAMILDGTLVSAPRIRARIDGGRAIINGDFTYEHAAELAARLTAE